MFDTLSDILDASASEVTLYKTYEQTVGSLLDASKKPPLARQWYRDRYPLYQFVREAWPVIETEPFREGWHIDQICRHLQACLETAAPVKHLDLPEIRNLLINIPPRCSKSIITSVMFPAYCWISFPQASFLYISYSQQLSLRDAEKSRQLMQSSWYQSRWGDQWKFSSTQSVKSFFYNDMLGSRFSSSVTGAATGFGALFCIGDDLHSVSEDFAESRAEIETAKAFWRDVIPSRSTDPTRMIKIVVGQRIATDDVSEMVEAQGNYQTLIVPMIFDEEGRAAAERSHTALDYRDPRFETGELLLQPDRFTPAVVEEYKWLGTRFHSQYQQTPQSEAITLFPRVYWNYFEDWPDVDWFDEVIQSWDLRFTDEQTSTTSFVAGHVWAKRGPDVFLLDRYFERASFPATLDAIVQMTRKWPTSYGKLIELKANGPAIIQVLRSKVTGLVPVQVGGSNLRKGGGSKFQRAQAVSWIQRAGNAYLPHHRLARWTEDFITNCHRFPAAPDDDVDAMSQAWRHLITPPPARDETREARRRREVFLEQKFRAFQGEQRAALGSRTSA